MTEIPLSKGKFAIIDDEDLATVGSFKWSLGSSGYAQRTMTLSPPTNGKRNRKTIRLHQQLSTPIPGLVTDHINRDRLDNRKSNLRQVTPRENNLNRSKGQGVYLDIAHKRWRANITIEGKQLHLGYFKDLWDALSCRYAAVELFNNKGLI